MENEFLSEILSFSEKLESSADNLKLQIKDWSKANFKINRKPFSLYKREYLIEILDHVEECIANRTPFNVTVQKSSQCGVSELAVLISFYFMDALNENVFYAFPNDKVIGQFVQSRIKPRIEDSEYLTNRFSKTDNIGLKQLGQSFIFFRGTNTGSQLKSADVEFVVFDELDEWLQSSISVLEKRLGDTELKHYRWMLKLSTPTFPDYGINYEFQKTDMREWHIKCPQCRKQQVIDFFESIEPSPTRDKTVEPESPPRYVCRFCNADIYDRSGEWIPRYPERKLRGYHISKLITEKASVLWYLYRDADAKGLEAFFNHDLGIPFSPEGGKLKDSDLRSCIDSNFPNAPASTYMGVDVGKVLNVVIKKRYNNLHWVIDAKTEVTFEGLDRLMEKHDINVCVIDGLPETRMAKAFRDRFPGRVFLAYYNLSDDSKFAEFDRDEGKVRLHRTNMMESVANNVMTRKTRYPVHIETINDFFRQMKAPQRVEQKNEKTGNIKYVYLEGNNPDHYYHADVYCEAALFRNVPASVDAEENFKTINHTESDDDVDYGYEPDDYDFSGGMF